MSEGQGTLATVKPPPKLPQVIQTTSAESPSRRTLTASALSAVNLGLKVGANLLIIPICLRYLGREGYGVWIILQSVASYLILTDVGLGQTVVNFQGVAFARGDFEEVNRILTTSFVLYFIVVAPVWLVLGSVSATQPIADWFLKDAPAGLARLFAPYLFLVVTLALLKIPLNVFNSCLLGLREITLRQISEFAVQAFLFLGTILTLVWGGRLLALILVTNLGYLIIITLNYPVVVHRHPQVRLAHRFWTPAYAHKLLFNSFFFFLYGVGFYFQRAIGNILAGRFGSLGRVPEMFVLLVIFRIAGWSLVDILSRTLQPYIILFAAQDRWERVAFFTEICTKFSVVIGVFFSVLVLLFADIGLDHWLGSGMFLGYGPLTFLAGAFLIEIVFTTSINFMAGLNRFRGVSMIMFVYAMFSLVLGVAGAKWLMPADPLFGLCIGFFVASVLGQAAFLPWAVNSWLHIGWQRYFEGFLLRPISLGVLSTVLLVMFHLVGAGAILYRGLEALTLLGLLSAFSWSSVLNDNERQWVGRLIRSSLPLVVD